MYYQTTEKIFNIKNITIMINMCRRQAMFIR